MTRADQQIKSLMRAFFGVDMCILIGFSRIISFGSLMLR